MTIADFFDKVKKASKKPPRVVIRRVYDEVKVRLGAYTTPWYVRHFDNQKLLKNTRADSIEALWQRLAQAPSLGFTQPVDRLQYQLCCPQDEVRILDAAEQAMQHRVSLLGTGWIDLGDRIDWHRDYKTGIRWQPQYITRISYSNPNDPSDVKIPWEISRMQWLMPLGQAYLLTGDERYAQKVRAVLEHWIAENPCAQSVNWTCTMEAAMRIFVWTWFFQVFNKSQAWQSEEFKGLFLRNLYLHGDFTEQHIERSDINGNHYTADAAAMVVAGCFFGEGNAPQRWNRLGWQWLNDELPKQVFADGVDYEASIPYHRLVLELFFWPMRYRQLLQQPISEQYIEYLRRMAWFSLAYTQPNGQVPVWGDADDARTLPFDNTHINDHRYLAAMVGLAIQDSGLLKYTAGPKVETFWQYGQASLSQLAETSPDRQSMAFPEGGFYVMAHGDHHVVIDCGPLGLANRGGHGHNDLLSFEAVLAGERLIADCGAYVYTADFKERNNFRSTAYHNTPQVDGQEINRYIRWDYLWNLHHDANFEVKHWEHNDELTVFVGSHDGYRRLEDTFELERQIELRHQEGSLVIQDSFRMQESHQVSIPFHLDPLVEIITIQKDHVQLKKNGKTYEITWQSSGSKWELHSKKTRISASYGRVQDSKQLVWTSQATGQVSLTCRIAGVK
jgi:uncharacterized heparinase superfamily protein